MGLLAHAVPESAPCRGRRDSHRVSQDTYTLGLRSPTSGNLPPFFPKRPRPAQLSSSHWVCGERLLETCQGSRLEKEVLWGEGQKKPSTQCLPTLPQRIRKYLDGGEISKGDLFSALFPKLSREQK